MMAMISATGRAIPFFMIFFSRVHSKAFSGTASDATRTGWISNDVLEHFVAREHPSIHHPKLIIMDNHKPLTSLKAIISVR